MDPQYIPAWMFLSGFIGSASVETVKILLIYERGTPFPARYKKIGFWVVRTVLALIGGGLSVAYEITNPIIAFHIGASASSIIENLSRTPAKE